MLTEKTTAEKPKPWETAVGAVEDAFLLSGALIGGYSSVTSTIVLPSGLNLIFVGLFIAAIGKSLPSLILFAANRHWEGERAYDDGKLPAGKYISSPNSWVAGGDVSLLILGVASYGIWHAWGNEWWMLGALAIGFALKALLDLGGYINDQAGNPKQDSYLLAFAIVGGVIAAFVYLGWVPSSPSPAVIALLAGAVGKVLVPQSTS